MVRIDLRNVDTRCYAKEVRDIGCARPANIFFGDDEDGRAGFRKLCSFFDTEVTWTFIRSSRLNSVRSRGGAWASPVVAANHVRMRLTPSPALFPLASLRAADFDIMGLIGSLLRFTNLRSVLNTTGLEFGIYFRMCAELAQAPLGRVPGSLLDELV
jgi:hypothetical protein